MFPRQILRVVMNGNNPLPMEVSTRTTQDSVEHTSHATCNALLIASVPSGPRCMGANTCSDTQRVMAETMTCHSFHKLLGAASVPAFVFWDQTPALARPQSALSPSPAAGTPPRQHRLGYRYCRAYTAHTCATVGTSSANSGE